MTDPLVPSDAELVGRALDGDDNAFTQIMRRHKADIFRLARRYTGDAEAGLDVVQESFVSAWKALGRYDGKRPFGTWLRTIALNKCRDRGRRHLLRRMVFGQADLEAPEAQRQADPTPDGQAALLAREQREALERALAQLPDGLKAPLILTYFDGLSQQQTGEVLGLTAKAVEIRVYRARRRLGELLALDPATADGEG